MPKRDARSDADLLAQVEEHLTLVTLNLAPLCVRAAQAVADGADADDPVIDLHRHLGRMQHHVNAAVERLPAVTRCLTEREGR